MASGTAEPDSTSTSAEPQNSIVATEAHAGPAAGDLGCAAPTIAPCAAAPDAPGASATPPAPTLVVSAELTRTDIESCAVLLTDAVRGVSGMAWRLRIDASGRFTGDTEHVANSLAGRSFRRQKTRPTLPAAGGRALTLVVQLRGRAGVARHFGRVVLGPGVHPSSGALRPLVLSVRAGAERSGRAEVCSVSVTAFLGVLDVISCSLLPNAPPKRSSLAPSLARPLALSPLRRSWRANPYFSRAPRCSTPLGRRGASRFSRGLLATGMR